MSWMLSEPPKQTLIRTAACRGRMWRLPSSCRRRLPAATVSMYRTPEFTERPAHHIFTTSRCVVNGRAAHNGPQPFSIIKSGSDPAAPISGLPMVQGGESSLEPWLTLLDATRSNDLANSSAFGQDSHASSGACRACSLRAFKPEGHEATRAS